MRMAMLAILFLAAGLVYAQDEDESVIEVPQDVIDQLGVIEEINVTAEKPPAEDSEAIDADIEAILDEADAIDAERE